MKTASKMVEPQIKSKKSCWSINFPFTRSNNPVLLPLCTSDFGQMCIEELSDHCRVLILQLRDIVRIADGYMRGKVSKKNVKKIKKAEELICSYRNLILAVKEKILNMDIPTAEGKSVFINSYPMDRIPTRLKYNFSQINVAFDGSCFYRAVSIACTGRERYLEEMKLLTLEWMVSNREQIETKIKDEFEATYEEYFNTALQYSGWANYYHVAVLAVALGRPIHCYRSLRNSHILQMYGDQAEDFGYYPVITGEKRDPIVLQHVSAGYGGWSYLPNHYIPLLINSKSQSIIQRRWKRQIRRQSATQLMERRLSVRSVLV